MIKRFKLKFLFIIFVLLLCNVFTYANDTYYLTPSQEIIAWNKWRADIGNYLSKNGSMAKNCSANITFNVDKNKKISDLNIVYWITGDSEYDTYPILVYGDFGFQNELKKTQMYSINHHEGNDYKNETKKIISINKFQGGYIIRETYDLMKSLENSNLLDFPKGTKRTTTKVIFRVKAGKIATTYKESDFNDYEVIEL